jgi:hypothetical protein
MNVRLLIGAIVRETTVLIAQLATSGGLRAPLAHVAGRVFADLAAELEREGVPKKVSADMFGLALRTDQRRTQRLDPSQTDRGRSLWEAVLDHIAQNELVTREQLLKRFRRDDPRSLRGVVRDLIDSGLVFASGRGPRAVYRVTTADELDLIDGPSLRPGLRDGFACELRVADADATLRLELPDETLEQDVSQCAHGYSPDEHEVARLWQMLSAH